MTNLQLASELLKDLIALEKKHHTLDARIRYLQVILSQVEDAAHCYERDLEDSMSSTEQLSGHQIHEHTLINMSTEGLN